MQYGDSPKLVGKFQVDCKEMMFYQDMPIKFPGMRVPVLESRLNCFNRIITAAILDFIAEFGHNAFADVYTYVSAKYKFQTVGQPFNRPGWHADGFMTNDINYIWSDKNPTVFNFTRFNLTQDDKISMLEMVEQANPANDYTFSEGDLLRLNQYNIHRVADVKEPGMRTFCKVTFSPDRFDLLGNAHNYLLDYDWEMKPRAIDRNVPQSSIMKEA